MPEYTPTTEEIRDYIAEGGEPRPWIELNAEEEAKENARTSAFDRWLAAHDKEVAARALEDAADRADRMYAGTDGTANERAWISGVSSVARRLREHAASIRPGGTQ